MQKQPFERFFKKMFRIIYEKKSVAGICFFEFSCEFCEIVRTAFSENSTGRLLLIVAV